MVRVSECAAYSEIILIECQGEGTRASVLLVPATHEVVGRTVVVRRIDHAPGNDLAATSIGQVNLILQGRNIEYERTTIGWQYAWWSDPVEDGGLGADHRSLGDLVPEEILRAAGIEA